MRSKVLFYKSVDVITFLPFFQTAVERPKLSAQRSRTRRLIYSYLVLIYLLYTYCHKRNPILYLDEHLLYNYVLSFFRSLYHWSIFSLVRKAQIVFTSPQTSFPGFFPIKFFRTVNFFDNAEFFSSIYFYIPNRVYVLSLPLYNTQKKPAGGAF